MAVKERKPPENNKAIEKTLRKHKNCEKVYSWQNKKRYGNFNLISSISKTGNIKKLKVSTICKSLDMEAT